MDLLSILTKTAKGLTEASGKTNLLSRSVRNILSEVDGRTPVADIAGKRGKIPAAELLEAMKALEKEGFVQKLYGN
jgi:DNA-binding Lrp family transcriptional regulator